MKGSKTKIAGHNSEEETNNQRHMAKDEFWRKRKFGLTKAFFTSKRNRKYHSPSFPTRNTLPAATLPGLVHENPVTPRNLMTSFEWLNMKDLCDEQENIPTLPMVQGNINACYLAFAFWQCKNDILNMFI